MTSFVADCLLRVSTGLYLASVQVKDWAIALIVHRNRRARR
ncbi:hypothetical protein [Ferranicluibacter rubi]|nr:hypothetical protein [Ferranicluibacter rubi]